VAPSRAVCMLPVGTNVSGSGLAIRVGLAEGTWLGLAGALAVAVGTPLALEIADDELVAAEPQPATIRATTMPRCPVPTIRERRRRETLAVTWAAVVTPSSITALA
jgi:hypothetical protein